MKWFNTQDETSLIRDNDGSELMHTGIRADHAIHIRDARTAPFALIFGPKWFFIPRILQWPRDYILWDAFPDNVAEFSMSFLRSMASEGFYLSLPDGRVFRRDADDWEPVPSDGQDASDPIERQRRPTE